MCGIAGQLHYDRTRPVDPELIRRMTDAIVHRGPDGEGHYINGPVGLGHRRLSIIDLSGGAQPMCNEDRTVWVTFNGEIYNFQELRRELLSCGHQFKSNSDTEVIVHAYEEWGPACVKRFGGMFAFALWDGRTNTLLIARDRVGIKPLYYVDTGRSLSFASELKALLVDPEVPRALNPATVERFLTYLFLPGNETLFQHVRKLEPGCYMTVREGRLQTQRYWDLSFEKSNRWSDFPDAVNDLRALLRQAVKDHMISDVPVGVLLSGGLDSTAILRYAVEASDKRVQTFTVAFAGQQVADERPYARLAADQFGTDHHDITFDASQFREFLPSYVWHMEEPVCEPPAVALYFVARLARQSSVKVLLSGEGGDEAFGGYETYRNIQLLERLKNGLGPARSSLRVSLDALSSLGWRGAGRYAPLVGKHFPDYYRSRAALAPTAFNRLRDTLYTPTFLHALQGSAFDDVAVRLGGPMNGRSVLDQMLYVDTKTWLPDELLVKADKMTMATSTELRVPLLDTRVLEFAAALPAHFKVRNLSTKRVLRAALSESVPSAILRRKKAGFPVPYAQWMTGELRDYVHDLLLGDAAITQYLDRTALRRFVADTAPLEGASKELFSLLVLELWHRQFVGPSVEAAKR